MKRSETNYTHELKCWPEPFEALVSGRKLFEFRKNRRRKFKVEDDLFLREWDETRKRYTGRCLWAEISYVLSEGFGMPEGYSCLSLTHVSKVWGKKENENKWR